MAGTLTFYKDMGKSTLIGLGAGFGLIVVAIASENGLMAFISVSSMIIVLGGVLSAAMINFHHRDIVKSFRLVQKALSRKDINLIEQVEVLIMFARRARRNGLLVLDADLKYVDDSYLRTAIELAVDGVSGEDLESILTHEIESVKRESNIATRIFRAMGGYAPAFGMIGTVIGLVLMLRTLNQNANMGASLAVALITTFYGSILANLVFIPLAGMLNESTERKTIKRRLIMTGILSMTSGENPRLLEKKLLSFLSSDERDQYMEEHSGEIYNHKVEEKNYENWLSRQRDKEVLIEAG